jgi:hypothetical protein
VSRHAGGQGRQPLRLLFRLRPKRGKQQWWRVSGILEGRLGTVGRGGKVGGGGARFAGTAGTALAPVRATAPLYS